MTNSDFWKSMQNIIADGFSAEGLAKLEEYAEQFITGGIIYQRFSPQGDLHDENVIRSAEGNVFVIDCDIRINTPELRQGGTREICNEVIVNKMKIL